MTPSCLSAADHVEELDRRLRVESRGRLVEDRDLGLLHQDLGEAEALAHAAREGGDALVGDVGQPHPRQRGRNPAGTIRRRNAHQPRGIGEVLGGGEIVVEADLIRQVADAAFDRERLAHRITVEHADGAGRYVGQAEHHQDGGGLAGAVRTEQPEDLALRDVEGRWPSTTVALP